ncbi:MAG: hypothetical protein WDN31_09695 [Hyphomicrobium sp.]
MQAQGLGLADMCPCALVELVADEDAGVITIEMVMLAALGFLTAALLALFIAPLYRRRVARLTTEALKRSMPLTETEIRADKDRLRAEIAIRIHKLETKVEEAAEASARQMVELNRRDANISELEGELARHLTSLEEHENARRVLEQTIMDRLPKVEHRRRANCCSSAIARSSH